MSARTTEIVSQLDGQEAAPTTVEDAPSTVPPAATRKTGPSPRRWRGRLLWFGVVVVLAGAVATWSATRNTSSPPGPVIAQSGMASVRAEVLPAKRATLAAINPGTVDALFVDAGQMVQSKEPIARVQGPGGAEIIVAPWQGTLTTLRVHLGDTVMSGGVIGTIADLGQLQVETEDVDEFQVAKLDPGQTVEVSIDALNRTIPSRIRTVALEPQLNAAGDNNYLVVIDLAARPPDLRSGMTAHVQLHE